MAAQSGGYALSLRDVPVRTALEDLVSLTGISLVYASEVVRDRRTVCRMESALPEELLRCIVEGAELDFYRLSSGTYVVIDGPEALPAYGTVSGQIVDDVTGEPVPNATVALADGSRTARSNSAGVFLLNRLLPGPHQLVVTQAGYGRLQLPLEIFSSANTRRQIRLQPEVLELDPIVVEGMRNVGGGVSDGLDRQNGYVRGPAMDGAIAQQARSGLGVSRRPLFADLSIQGGAPGEHMVRLDGVPVFDPVTLGRSRSAFSPLALRRITVRKAGFGVEHGSFGGGVIDVEHALTDRSGPSGATAMLDPFSLNGDGSLPLRVFGGEGTVMVAGRTSVWDLYREPGMEQALRDWNQIDPLLMQQLSQDGPFLTGATEFGDQDYGSSVAFSDVHGAFRLEFPGFRSLQGTFYRGTNDVGTELLTSGLGPDGSGPPRFFLTREDYRWSNTLGQLRLDALLGDRASLEARAWASRHTLDHGYALAETTGTGGVVLSDVEDLLRSELSLRPPQQDGNRIQEWGAALTGDLAAGGGHFLTAGVEGVRIQARTEIRNGFLRPILFQARNVRLSAFLQDRWRISRALSVEAGVRVTSVEGRGSYGEPRLAARLDGYSDALGPWSLRLAGGVYRQFLNQFALSNVGPSALVPDVRFWLPADESLDPADARHLALEAAARPWSGWEFRGEAFYKAMDRILELDYSALVAPASGDLMEMDQSDFVGEADGVAYGIGGRVSWERGRARVQMAYDWTVSERTFPARFDGARQPTPWIEPHRLLVQGRVPLFGGWAIDAESRNVWGRTWALRRAYYDFLSLHDSQDELPIGLPGDDDLPTLHQLDVGVSWLGELSGLLTEFRAELRNAQWDRQVLDYSLVQSSNGSGETEYQRRPRLLPGPVLNLSVRVGF